MTKKDAISIIAAEIKWCEENRGKSAETKDFERGLIYGLKQAQFLIRKIPTNK